MIHVYNVMWIRIQGFFLFDAQSTIDYQLYNIIVCQILNLYKYTDIAEYNKNKKYAQYLHGSADYPIRFIDSAGKEIHIALRCVVLTYIFSYRSQNCVLNLVGKQYYNKRSKYIIVWS